MRQLLAVAVVGASLMAMAAPASADYGGRADSNPYGAQYGYTVTHLDGAYGSITGTVRDKAADGYCAYTKVSIAINAQPDPSATAIACGTGKIATLNKDAHASNVFGISVTGIKIKVCLSNSSGSLVTACTYKTESAKTS